MRRRALWVWVVAAMALAVAVAAWYPGHRLDREIAAARREGVWTEMDDVRKAIAAHLPPGENAAPLIQKAIAATRNRRVQVPGLQDGLRAYLKGGATDARYTKVRDFIAKNPDLLGSWRRAAKCPRLDYDRPWEKGYAVLFPELMEVKEAARLLVAAAKTGLDPTANLLAAARLAVLTGQEPVLIAQLVRVSIARLALREAAKEGLGRKVESALGPPIDLRWAYASEPAFTIGTMGQLGGPAWNRMMGSSADDGLLYRFRRAGPGKANALFGIVHEYPALWRELPKDGTDYAAAIPVMDRHYPKIAETMARMSAVMASLSGADEGADQTMDEPLKSFAKLEAERKAVREGRPIPSASRP